MRSPKEVFEWAKYREFDGVVLDIENVNANPSWIDIFKRFDIPLIAMGNPPKDQVQKIKSTNLFNSIIYSGVSEF